LAAHAAGVERGQLPIIEASRDVVDRFRELVARRAERVPLQHLTGSAPFGPVTVEVGPGVFIPRPETESIFEWAAAQRFSHPPVVVDLCTGSGALALALSSLWPGARVVAIDDSTEALEYASRNLAGTDVELIKADVTDRGLLPELDGTVHLVVANPPYIPDGAELEPEVGQYDPTHALFGGPDGMRVIDAIVPLAARWLRVEGRCAVEHDDTTSAQTVTAFTRTGLFDDVTARHDMAGRTRFVTAIRNPLRG
jgi:release factor glutamine methyltransferase